MAMRKIGPRGPDKFAPGETIKLVSAHFGARGPQYGTVISDEGFGYTRTLTVELDDGSGEDYEYDLGADGNWYEYRDDDTPIVISRANLRTAVKSGTTAEATTRLTVKQLKRMLAEAVDGPPVSVDAAIYELGPARRHLSDMSSMTPFSMWYKGDHKKATVSLAKAAQQLAKSAAAEGDKKLQRAALDYAYAVRHGTGGEARDNLDAVIAARKTRTAGTS